MRITTSKCGQFKHPEFVLEADDIAVPDVYLKELAETIEQMVAAGSVFRPGQTFQIGWMITQVASSGASRLSLVEPDMEEMPMQWVLGVTETLRQKMVQVFMLDSVSLRQEMKIPSVLQSLVACTRYSAPSFIMVRSEGANERDSGWFVGCLDDEHDHNDPANLSCVSLYEAYLNQQGIQGFVTFPVGTMIVNDKKNGLTILKDDKPLKIEPGSFLDTWLKRGGG